MLKNSHRMRKSAINIGILERHIKRKTSTLLKNVLLIGNKKKKVSMRKEMWNEIKNLVLKKIKARLKISNSTELTIKKILNS